MRVLVTGAGGFIGSNIVRRLVLAGHDVAVSVRPTSNMSRLNDIVSRLRMIQNDDKAALRSFRPDATVHSAWRGVYYDRSDSMQVANVGAASSVLQASLDAGCRCWIGLGSLAEYGPSPFTLREEMAATPVTAYGAAKLAACFETRALCARDGVRFVWLRLSSIYGPGDNPNWVIPYVITTLLAGQSPTLTSGEQRRDFLFVEDAAEAIEAVMSADHAEGIFNLASGHAPPLRETLEQLRNLINPELALGFACRASASHSNLQADPSRLCAMTGWQPRTELPDGLRRTVAWLKTMKESQERLL